MNGIDSCSGERVSGALTAKVLYLGKNASPAAIFIGDSRVGVVEVEHRAGRHFVGNKSPSLLNNQAHGFCLDGDLEAVVRAAMLAGPEEQPKPEAISELAELRRMLNAARFLVGHQGTPTHVMRDISGMGIKADERAERAEAEIERLQSGRTAAINELGKLLDHAREKEVSVINTGARTLWIGRTIGLKAALEVLDPVGDVPLPEPIAEITGTVEAS